MSLWCPKPCRGLPSYWSEAPACTARLPLTICSDVLARPSPQAHSALAPRPRCFSRIPLAVYCCPFCLKHCFSWKPKSSPLTSGLCSKFCIWDSCLTLKQTVLLAQHSTPSLSCFSFITLCTWLLLHSK